MGTTERQMSTISLNILRFILCDAKTGDVTVTKAQDLAHNNTTINDDSKAEYFLKHT